MSVDPEIVTEIVNFPSDDLTELRQHLTAQFGRVLSVGMIKKIREQSVGAQRRRENISRARERASEGLENKMELMASVASDLHHLFRNEALPLKDRIEAAKELRQWTKLTIDTAGIHDEKDDVLFVIGSAWAPDDAG